MTERELIDPHWAHDLFLGGWFYPLDRLVMLWECYLFDADHEPTIRAWLRRELGAEPALPPAPPPFGSGG